MNVYLEPEAWLSRSIHRVAKALTLHVPKGVAIVDNRKRADLEVLHLVGWGGVPVDIKDHAGADTPFGERDYAVIQYCVRTTESGDPITWRDRIWQKANLVWSYYDLPAMVNAAGGSATFPFYQAPLGVDASVFKVNGWVRDYTIGTSGYVAKSESINEVRDAVRIFGGRHFHLGPQENVPGAHEYAHDVSDADVARWWGRCRYVSGLRREEGFELPAYEGLLCGARPIVFDAPHYRAWLKDSAVYVPEVEPEALTRELVRVFEREAEPVSEEERRHFVELLDWGRIAKGFWERALS